MNQPANNASQQARISNRKSEIAQQRRSGNGSMQDVADFFGVSVRQVANWKKDRLIGHSQVGGNVWFSAEDVATFAVEYHHASKFSKMPAAEVKAQVWTEWKQFLGAMDQRDAMDARITAIERFLQAASMATELDLPNPKLILQTKEAA